MDDEAFKIYKSAIDFAAAPCNRHLLYPFQRPIAVHNGAVGTVYSPESCQRFWLDSFEFWDSCLPGWLCVYALLEAGISGEASEGALCRMRRDGGAWDLLDCGNGLYDTAPAYAEPYLAVFSEAFQYSLPVVDCGSDSLFVRVLEEDT